jgi:hypothetical protein
MRTFYPITFLCLALFAFAAQAQNLLTNGSFELGDGPNSLDAGDTNLFGWTISGDKSLYFVRPSPAFQSLTPPDGTNYVDLNGKEGSITLSQSFPTTPGQLYEVTFSAGYFQATNPGPPYFFTATVTSATGATLSTAVVTAPNARGWLSPTRFLFEATTTTSTLLFTDTSGTVNYDLTLDAVSVTPVMQTNVFAEIIAFNTTTEIATGTLNGVAFTLQSTRAAARPGSGDDGGIVDAITNNTSSAFSAAAFTPAQALGDHLVLGAASDFRITFAQAVSNVTLHLYQLQANRLSFTTSGVPATFSLLSSDGDFTVSASNTAIQGSPGNGDDASGSLLFAGAFTELAWTSATGSGTTPSTPDDGIGLQLSVPVELRPVLNIAPGATAAQLARLTWKTNFTGYTLESTPVLPATNWTAVTNAVTISGEHFSVTVPTQDPARFFRLGKD